MKYYKIKRCLKCSKSNISSSSKIGELTQLCMECRSKLIPDHIPDEQKVKYVKIKYKHLDTV